MTISSVRLARRSGAALIAAGLFAVPMIAGAAAPAVAPPNGTYNFAIAQAGTKIGTSTVTVTRSMSAVTSHEVETFTQAAEPLTVDQSLEPVALAPTSYSTTPCRLNAQVAVTAHVTFDANGADETVDGTSGATHFPLETGTSHMVVIDAAFMTGFLFLPAQVQAESLTTFTGLATCSATSLVYTVDTTPQTRPSTVPAADANLTVDVKQGSATLIITEWYNPQTMVVDEVDVPASQIVISRSPGAAS